ncbi:exosortase-associated protein EpsI, V-type [Altericroceibacterium xinjiangense]|uniref:exosortase-associated protein EpsI, V-type n=1 Tax=Altericroceibacterium xinjiangense TaxID=762261 RepID=UPI000F7E4446|nr:exosortase-associated protein EpsI, V-type [Altericroceibacterium xinjiangense]
MARQMLSATTTRRDALLGGAMLLTGAVAWARLPSHPIVAVAQGDVSDAIPMRAGHWGPAPSGDVVMPPQDERNAAEVYEEQVMRSYVRSEDSPAIMFVLAYARSQSGMLMVHRPESCYPGAGFTITADEPVTIPLAPGVTPHGRFLSTQRDERIEQVLYWTRLGNEFPNSWDQERRFLALQNLRGLAPDGALIRVSTIDPDAEGAKVRLTRFAAALYAASGGAGRAILGGPASASAERV